jgi:hypothetical protein
MENDGCRGDLTAAPGSSLVVDESRARKGQSARQVDPRSWPAEIES